MSNTLSFGKMVVKGYASILSAEFDWSLEGLNIIQATNGSGKTQFINALVWALYGKTLKGSVTPWDFLQADDFKGTMVCVNLFNGKNIEVTRCKNYTGKIRGAAGKNRLILKVDGEEPEGLRDKKDYQQWLENELGYSFELFKNSIVFGQKLKRLISETGPNKKKIFDEAFEVEYIPKARKITDVEMKKALQEYNSQQLVTDVLLSDISNLENNIKNESLLVTNFENNKAENIAREESYINKLEKEVKAEKSELLAGKYKGLDKAIIKCREELIKLNNDLSSLGEVSLNDKLRYETKQKTISETKSTPLLRGINNLNSELKSIPDKCSHCNKPFTTTEKAKEKRRLQLELEKIEKEYKSQLKHTTISKEAISALNTQLSSVKSIKESISSLEDKIEELEDLQKEVKDINKTIGKLNGDINNHTNSIKFFKAQVLKTNIEKTEKTIIKKKGKYKKEKRFLRRLKTSYKTQKWLMDDPLSNSGLKAFIFNQMLDGINDRLDYYSKFIGFQVTFDIDMDSANRDLNTFIYIKGNQVPYEDLSGGQQQTVDVATAFAIHDIVNSGRECKLLIMDEIFESLDKHNIEIVSDLIQDKVNGKCLYLITHRVEFIPVNTNVILVKYKDGITSMA